MMNEQCETVALPWVVTEDGELYLPAVEMEMGDQTAIVSLGHFRQTVLTRCPGARITMVDKNRKRYIRMQGRRLEDYVFFGFAYRIHENEICGEE